MTAQARNAAGMQALAAGNLIAAIAAFEDAIAFDPQAAALRLNLAAAHRGNRDGVREETALRGLLAIDPRSLIGHVRLAEILDGRGRVSDAVQHWSAAVQLADGDPTSAANREIIARGRQRIAAHNATFAEALDRAIGTPLPDDRAGRRFRACADHMLGRRPIFRNECSGVFYPFLPVIEYFERDLFPWFDVLERRSPEIRREALRLLADMPEALRPYVRMDEAAPTGPWAQLNRSLDWAACFLWEFGRKNEAVCDLCPATVAALAEIPQTNAPGKAPTAFFSVLRPGARIPPHTGVTNTRAIVHLPLVVPERCGFRVGGETRAWRENEAFAFDDTIEHEAWNDGDASRIVLIFDVWNPYLENREQEYLIKLFAIADEGLTGPPFS